MLARVQRALRANVIERLGEMAMDACAGSIRAVIGLVRVARKEKFVRILRGEGAPGRRDTNTLAAKPLNLLERRCRAAPRWLGPRWDNPPTPWGHQAWEIPCGSTPLLDPPLVAPDVDVLLPPHPLPKVPQACQRPFGRRMDTNSADFSLI